jgi:hypothetical protein
MDPNSVKAALKKFQNNPALFFEKILGVETIEDYQRAILRDIPLHDRIAIAACHDVGKSWTMARIVIWFATCFPYSKVITTAPTYNQVKNILWSEIRAAHSRAKFPLGGKLNLTDWQLTREGDWFAIGFTPRNELTDGEGQGTQSSFQGFHAPYILVVFDEATGIPHNVWTMAEGLLTSGNVKFIPIGNPTSRNSEFFQCFKSAAWHKIYLSCFDSPNLIANGITDMDKIQAELELLRSLPDSEAQERMKAYKVVRPYLLTLKWVMSMLLKWGIDHPLSQGKIFGRFPREGDNTLISLGAVEDAQLRVADIREGDRKIIGIDVARFGTDASVFTALHGRKQIKYKQMHKRDNVEIAGEAIALARELWPGTGADLFVVDETGLGSGVVDILNERSAESNGRFSVRGVQFGGGLICETEGCRHDRDCDKAKYVNVKARMFDLLREDVRKEDGLQLLNESVYLEELPSIRYSFDSKGRMVLESKEDFKKRTGRGSPDASDSLALANYGRYNEMAVGTFGKQDDNDFGTPFANSLGARSEW